jgi:archaellum component FlaC
MKASDEKLEATEKKLQETEEELSRFASSIPGARSITKGNTAKKNEFDEKVQRTVDFIFRNK